MLKKKMLLFSMIGLIGSLNCFADGSDNPDNEVELCMDKISKLIISYDMENIDFYRSESEKLIIKEFMSSNKKRYYADISRHSDSFKITEGKRPIWDNSFTCRVEVYLPDIDNLELTVTTTGGKISMDGLNWTGKTFHADSTFGLIKINSISADLIKLSTTRGEMELETLNARAAKIENTSGIVRCANLTGSVTYLSTNGAIYVKSADGRGSYKAGSGGILDVRYANITGDIEMRSKNNDINLALPTDVSFEYSFKTKNGRISTDFPVDGENNSGEICGHKGVHPEYSIKIETTNGNISVSLL
ncbi:MAG: DUF4097 family beta strand repeat-containing protein [Spirochaetales bacterium]|nr:DUF4097 family beta strand repeat-containing protein [Spirochaetales bacterium]